MNLIVSIPYTITMHVSGDKFWKPEQHCKCLYSNYSHGIVKTNQNYKQLLIELNTYKIYTFYSHSIVLLCFEHIETSIIWL